MTCNYEEKDERILILFDDPTRPCAPAVALVKRATLSLEVWKINGYNRSATHFSWKDPTNFLSKADNSVNFAELEAKNKENCLYEEYDVVVSK